MIKENENKLDRGLEKRQVIIDDTSINSKEIDFTKEEKPGIGYEIEINITNS